ncbi:hypothetical protein Tco_0530564 [Tanacetum coccineum]
MEYLFVTLLEHHDYDVLGFLTIEGNVNDTLFESSDGYESSDDVEEIDYVYFQSNHDSFNGFIDEPQPVDQEPIDDPDAASIDPLFKVAFDDLRDVLSVIYLIFTHSRVDHVRSRWKDVDEDPVEDPIDFNVDGGRYRDVVEGSSVAPSAEETKPFETDESAATPPPHPAYRVARLLTISTPPSSPLSPWSSPLPQIPSLSLPLSPPSPVWQPSLGIPPPWPISVPTSSPPLLLPSASRREDRPEVTLPPRKRLGIALGPGYEVRESSSATAARPAGGLRADYGFVATMDREIMCDPEREVGYGITDSWDEIVETLQGAPVSTNTELGRHMTAFETRVRQDTDEIYTRLDDEQSQRQLLAGRLNMLFRDRRAHAYTRHQIETQARLSRETWRQSMDASDLTRGEVMSLRTTVLGQMLEIRELHAVDRRRQTMTSEMLKADHRRSVKMRELRTADHTRQLQLVQTLTVMQSL